MTPRYVPLVLVVFVASLGILRHTALGQTPSFTGRYDTNWGEVILSQTGDRVTGSYSGKYSGSISGTVNGGTLHFQWRQTNDQFGRGVFRLSPDGRALAGTWGVNDSETNSGDWSGGRRGVNTTFFTTWQDPRENAFRLGVPAGWRISGGTARGASVDVRFVVRAESPDGTIRVFLDDPELPPRQVPNQMTAQMGLREGQVMRGAWGGPVLLSRYLTGEQFARQYIAGRLCPQAQVTASSPLIAASRELNAQIRVIAARASMAAEANIGEAYFRCGSAVGYTFANTFWVTPAGSGAAPIWGVDQLASVLVTDPAQAMFGAYVLHSKLETAAVNPQWEARQARLRQDVTGSVNQMQRAMAQSIAQHAQRQASTASAGGFNHPNNTRLPTNLRDKWAREDVSRQKYSDATLGSRWMHTPTGENVRVDNSSQHWWMDHSKNVVAGPADGSPPPGSQGQYTPLQNGWQR